MACTGPQASPEQGPQDADTLALHLPALVIWWLGRDLETKSCQVQSEHQDFRHIQLQDALSFGGAGDGHMMRCTTVQ